MTTYRVQRMTQDNFNRYMNGSYLYFIEELNIEADSKEEAFKKAEAEGYVVNECVRTLEEVEAEEKKAEERIEAERVKRENAKARKLANEIKKAEAEGMTLEEYRKAKNHKAHIKRVENEIAKLEKELAYKKRYLEELKAR